MFDFQLQEFAYTRPCRSEKSDDEIPVAFRWVVQLPLEVGVVCVAYDILQKRLLLDTDERHLQRRFADARCIGVHGEQPDIYRLWFESFYQERLVEEKILFRELSKLRCVLPRSKAVRGNRVGRLVGLPQECGEFFEVYHSSILSLVLL